MDEHYPLVTGMDTTLNRGKYLIGDGTVNYGIIGRVMALNLSLNPSDKLTPVTVYMLLREKKGLISQMGKEYKSASLYPSGTFAVGGDTDAQYVIAGKSFVERLLDQKGKISSLEIKVNESADESYLRERIQGILGEGFVIKNRYEQDAAFLKIMNIEKWISFLIATMVLLIIAFNMVGSLWMMVLEKKKDIAILRSMGYDTSRIRGIFIWEGFTHKRYRSSDRNYNRSDFVLCSKTIWHCWDSRWIYDRCISHRIETFGFCHYYNYCSSDRRPCFFTSGHPSRPSKCKCQKRIMPFRFFHTAIPCTYDMAKVD